MPYETSPEIDFSAIGLVVDVPANAVPTGGWSNSLNVRPKNNSVQGVNKFVDDIIFIHFSGKSKPWDVGGIFEEYSLIYHSIFEQLFNKKFHIVSTNRKNSIKKLFNYSKFFHRVQVNDLLIYIVHSIYAIIKKNNSI